LAIPGIVERLNPNPIPGEEELLFLPIPDSKGKHASEMLHTRLAIFLVGMKDHLSIAASCEAMSSFKQDFMECLVIVDFPIKDNGLCLVFVKDRLFAPCKINNAQSPMPQTNRPFEIEGPFVRPTMKEDRSHALDLLP